MAQRYDGSPNAFCCCFLAYWAVDVRLKKAAGAQILQRWEEAEQEGMPAWVAQRLQAATAEPLQTWAKRTLHAGTLEEIFR